MADSENWAKFPTSDGKSEEEQDDDWSDFGGFETAQPVTDPQASNTSGLISWATLSTTLDTTPQPSSAGITTKQIENSAVPPDLSQGSHWVAFPTDILTSHQSLDTTVQEQKLQELSSPATVLSTPVSNVETLRSEPENKDFNSSDSNIFPGKQITERSVNMTENSETVEQKYKEETQKATQLVDDLEGKLSLVEEEKLQLIKELENLMRKHDELEDASKSIQENLEDQKQKYSKLQEEHKNQLQEIHQAGHDALAIIVEEYKELSKKAVLEEREKNQVALHVFLEDERKKFQEIMTHQQESFERTLTEEREKNDERMKIVLQEEQENHKLATESALNKEREDFKGVLEMAVKEAREQAEEAVKAAVAKEKEMHLVFMEKMEKEREEERETFRVTIQEALNDERKQSKVGIQEALIEEQKKFRETVCQSIEETKSTMNEYIKQKQEMDLKTQQKQYLVMDLFLESARTQLKNLMGDKQES